MKVATLPQKPAVSTQTAQRRVIPAPERIMGIYRLSVLSKTPFSVDIGGREIEGVRSLEVFNGLPMYIDSMKHVEAVALWDAPGKPEKTQIRLAQKRTASFRITADEVLPEQVQLDERVNIASLRAKMPYEGFWKHIRKMREERNPELAYHTFSEESAMKELLYESLIGVGLGSVFVAPFVLSALGIINMVPVVMVAVDPWRTYINGHLYKNLKELKVRLRDAEVTGYMSL
jgi:hypothetical protein